MVSGVKPLTSPPFTLSTFDPCALEGHDLIFFKLHGQDGTSFWYGDGGEIACSAEQLTSAKLNGALVFAENCWGGEQSPMVQALLKAGAACVVTGTGLNIAGTTRIGGADVLAFIWRKAIEWGFTVEAALKIGKFTAKLRRPALAADIDSFQLLGRADARPPSGDPKPPSGEKHGSQS